MVMVLLGPSAGRIEEAGAAELKASKVGWHPGDAGGRKLEATTAFGMTDTMRGSRGARRTVFSLCT